ncbi:DUF6386 family protein [Pseudomonas sp. LFS097]|uniref:DUF6386 family protein n=1 Tax=Pseudomonas sp. LFS097 TaxID=3229883 RepID=UPI003A8058A1
MSVEFSVVTDTATLAIFDLKAIRHRVSDSFDWWSIQSDEISEPPTNGLTSIPPKPLPDLAGAKPVQVLYKTALHP